MKSNSIDRLVQISVSAALVAAIFITSSFVVLAQAPLSGELLVAGPGVVVNGEPATNGRALTLPSNVMTTGSTYATLNFGKVAKLQLAPGSTFTIDGSGMTLRGTLAAGSVTVVNTTNPIVITTPNGKTVTANSGDMVVADPNASPSQTTGRKGGFPVWGYAAIAGIIVVLIVAVTRGGDSNNGTSPTT